MPFAARRPTGTPITDVLIQAELIRRIGSFVSFDLGFALRFFYPPLLSRFYWGIYLPPTPWTESWPPSEASGSPHQELSPDVIVDQGTAEAETALAGGTAEAATLLAGGTAEAGTALAGRGNGMVAIDDQGDGNSDLTATTLELGDIRDLSE